MWEIKEQDTHIMFNHNVKIYHRDFIHISLKGGNILRVEFFLWMFKYAEECIQQVSSQSVNWIWFYLSSLAVAH